MELQTISQISKDYGISPRMLRYYEKVGLIQSQRKDDYAYRVYDEEAIIRLRQIIVLRKLRVSVKQITRIIDNTDAIEAIEMFRQNMSEIDIEITALSTVKSILARLIDELNEKVDLDLELLSEEAMFAAINVLSFTGGQLNDKRELSMEELTNADEALMRLEDKDVRIIYLPPMTIAAAYAKGEGCEGKASELISKFVANNALFEIKPDSRCFGFDCSQGASEMGENSQVYEMWVSIPDNMVVSEPLVRREFKGGLYAAHVLRAWDFQDWRRLNEWVAKSEIYDNDWGSERWESKETVFGQGFEETLNFKNYISKQGEAMNTLQLDLLFPIKEK